MTNNLCSCVYNKTYENIGIDIGILELVLLQIEVEITGVVHPYFVKRHVYQHVTLFFLYITSLNNVCQFLQVYTRNLSVINKSNKLHKIVILNEYTYICVICLLNYFAYAGHVWQGTHVYTYHHRQWLLCRSLFAYFPTLFCWHLT